MVGALIRRVHELHTTAIRMYQTDLKEIIFEAANSDLQYMELVTKLQQGKMQQKVEDYKLAVDGTFLYKNRIYVLPNDELRSLILREDHQAVYMAHPRVTKMKAELKPLLFWK